TKPVTNLDDSQRDKLLAALGDLDGRSFATAHELRQAIAVPLADFGISKANEKTVLDALTVRDESVEPRHDHKDNLEPDTDLRDNENVPLPTVSLEYERDVT